MKVLIVDDSVVFRTQISAALSGIPQIEVTGSAPNGSIALQKLKQLSVDLVTLDMEMPDMDGIEVLKAIREKSFNVRVIVFSSQTTKGAERALKALEAGADDVVAKPSSDDSQPNKSPQERVREALVPKILQFVKDSEKPPLVQTHSSEKFMLDSQSPNPEGFQKSPLLGFYPSAIVIASSTGGPTALELIFSQFPANLRTPILIAQHMPPVFTKILAKRLSDLSKRECDEAKHGEIITPGKIYVAPGDHHLQVVRKDGYPTLELHQGPQRNSVRPAADYLFESAATIFGSQCLGMVLTGMGQDGLCGALAVKRAGGRIVIQDEKSCVVFGMPGAVFRANCYDEIRDLEQITALLKELSVH
jgi:two-component system chemotaxis response regulator CheB